MGLSEEAHKALVVGTDSYPHSHTLWLLRLESERCASGEIGDCGEEEEGVCKKLVQLCSKAVDTIPAEVHTCVCVCVCVNLIAVYYRALCVYGSFGWTFSYLLTALPQMWRPFSRYLCVHMTVVSLTYCSVLL